MGRGIKPGINDLETWCEQNGELGQRILDEWDYEENMNHGLFLEPREFSYGSNINVWWKCKACGNKWELPIAYRTIHKTGCVLCSNKNKRKRKKEKNIEEKRDLRSYCKENGSWGKHIAEEWDYYYNLGEFKTTMAEVTCSSNVKYRWKCNICGRYFFQSPNARTKLKSGCRFCSRTQTSYPEQFIYNSLKQIYPETKNREKMFENLEYDIVIPELKMCIEYSGLYWHVERRDNDLHKKNVCEANGYKFIEIIEDKTFSDIAFKGDTIEIQRKPKDEITELLIKALKYIFVNQDRQYLGINFAKAQEETLAKMGVVENNITITHPQLLEEWDDKIKPESLTYGSFYKINWKCAMCGNKYRKEIYHRVKRNSGCPLCGYSSLDGKYHRVNKV